MRSEYKADMIEMAEGNPGAAKVLVNIFKFCETFEAEDYFPEILTWLKESNCTGPDLWILYKDKHQQNISGVMGEVLATMGNSGHKFADALAMKIIRGNN